MTPTAPFAVRRLKYAATINDEALSESTDSDLDLAYIDIGNVDSQGRIHDIVNYRFEDSPSRARRIVRDGDVIISTVRTYLQAIAPVESPPENLIVSTGFAVVRPSNILDHRFCKYALRANRFLWEVESRSTGVSYPAINASDLGDIKVSLPGLGAQRLIANYLDRETAHIDELIAEKERMLALLEEKRAALISRVVTRGLDPAAPLKNGWARFRRIGKCRPCIRDSKYNLARCWMRKRLRELTSPATCAIWMCNGALSTRGTFPKWILMMKAGSGTHSELGISWFARAERLAGQRYGAGN